MREGWWRAIFRQCLAGLAGIFGVWFGELVESCLSSWDVKLNQVQLGSFGALKPEVHYDTLACSWISLNIIKHLLALWYSQGRCLPWFWYWPLCPAWAQVWNICTVRLKCIVHLSCTDTMPSPLLMGTCCMSWRVGESGAWSEYVTSEVCHGYVKAIIGRTSRKPISWFATMMTSQNLKLF